MAPRKKVPAQQDIPGTKPASFKELDELAEGYLEVQEQRRQLAEEAKGSKAAIIETMKKHGVEMYRFEKHTFELSQKDVVRLKKQKDPQADTSHLDD
jgi:hypothetical protein